MRRLRSVFALVVALCFATLARADHLDGVLPLYADDLAAVAAAKKQPDRHVLLYFGDYLN